MYVFPIFVYTSANFIALSVRLCEFEIVLPSSGSRAKKIPKENV